MNKFNKDFYNRFGYERLGRTLSHRKLFQMRKECMESWKTLKENYDPSKNWLKNTLLDNIHHYSPLVKTFYISGPFLDIMKEEIILQY